MNGFRVIIIISNKGVNIKYKYIVGIVSGLILNGCATMRDSLIIGAGTGVVSGAVFGSQLDGDRNENAIKGAVIGGVIGGLTSYLIHGSLEKRDAEVRRDTLMNLEQYEVMGVDSKIKPNTQGRNRNGKCYQTREVDGRTVSVPCYLVNENEVTQ